MSIRYTDKQIEQFFLEKKILPEDYKNRIQLKDKRGHKEQELDVKGSDGSDFKIIFRQSSFNNSDFSIIFAVNIEGSNQQFRLRRYNGKCHEHTNQMEGNTFYDFHTHTATARYQELGMNEDSFAEPSDKYSDFQGALRCLLGDCGFVLPTSPQLSLFGEV